VLLLARQCHARSVANTPLLLTPHLCLAALCWRQAHLADFEYMVKLTTQCAASKDSRTKDYYLRAYFERSCEAQCLSHRVTHASEQSLPHHEATKAGRQAECALRHCCCQHCQQGLQQLAAWPS
jgi:hypothetical protein